jgi:ornithine carbamoyltransferase
MSATKRDLASIHDLSPLQVAEILTLSAELKDKLKRGIPHPTCAGKVLGMIFEKSSTRTRVSFQTGIYQLGGTGIFLSSRDIQIGRGEPIADTAQVLSRYVDCIMARTFAHKTITDLCEHSTIPVINGLSDLLHPCQGLTDVFTIAEKKGDLSGLKLAYVGDGNNMAHSLLYAGAKTGTHVAIASPAGYEVDAAVLAEARADAEATGAVLSVTTDPMVAVAGADAVYTDVWASMGQEAEQAQRVKDFAGFEVNAAMMAHAKADAIFLHCLPAHRGEEVSAEVIDGPQSVVFDQAENRLHVQKAIMTLLLA